jgi:hypothetical protein
MADIYSMTPGSAVAETLQQILQKRRDAERQIMLDRLGVEKFRLDEQEAQSRMKDADARTRIAQAGEERASLESKANIAQSEAATAESRIRQENELLEGLPFAPVEDPSQLPSELQDLMIRRGRATPGQATFDYQKSEGDVSPRAEVNAIDQALKAGPVKDMGSPDFQKDELQRQLIQKFKSSNQGLFQGNPELGAALDAAGAGVINQVPGSLFEPAPTLYHMGPTGKLTPKGTLPRGAQVVETGFAPQTNTANSTQVWKLTHPETGKTLDVVGTATDLTPYIAQGYRTDGKAGTVTAPPDQSGNVARAARDLGVALGLPRSANKAARVEQMRQNLLGAVPIPGPAKQFLQDVITDVERWLEQGQVPPTTEQIMASAKEDAQAEGWNLTAQQLTELQDTLNMVLSSVGN